MKTLKKLIKDQRAGGTIALKGLTIIMILMFVAMVIIDCFYIGICYTYIRTQMDFANRAVPTCLDTSKLADRQIYIDETVGREQFYTYLKNNLKLNNNLELTQTKLRIEGAIKVINFEIYNKSELPATLDIGKEVKEVSVYSRLEVKVRPIFSGVFGTVNIKPYIITDIPQNLLIGG